MTSFIIGWLISTFVLWLFGIDGENSIVIGFAVIVGIVILKNILKSFIGNDPRRAKVTDKKRIINYFDFWKFR